MDTLTPVRRGPRISLRLLRTVITVQALALLAQPVLAGRFLAGDVDSITVHGEIGTVLLGAAGLAAVAVSLGYVLLGRGRLFPVLYAVLQFGAVLIQVGAGYARDLALHVPLGTAMVLAGVLMAAWVWSPSAGRPR